MDYIYVTENNLENRQKYTYSQYGGEDFLNAYMDSRKSFIEEKLIEPEPVHVTYNELSMLVWGGVEGFDTLADAYVKTFEVRKRIYTAYDANWVPMTTDRTDYVNYILLAKVLIGMYKKTSCLKYVNCLLKVDDTLLSIKDNMPYSCQLELQGVLTEELSIYENLRNKIDSEK